MGGGVVWVAACFRPHELTTRTIAERSGRQRRSFGTGENDAGRVVSRSEWNAMKD